MDLLNRESCFVEDIMSPAAITLRTYFADTLYMHKPRERFSSLLRGDLPYLLEHAVEAKVLCVCNTLVF